MTDPCIHGPGVANCGHPDCVGYREYQGSGGDHVMPGDRGSAALTTILKILDDHTIFGLGCRCGMRVEPATLTVNPDWGRYHLAEVIAAYIADARRVQLVVPNHPNGCTHPEPLHWSRQHHERLCDDCCLRLSVWSPFVQASSEMRDA